MLKALHMNRGAFLRERILGICVNRTSIKRIELIKQTGSKQSLKKSTKNIKVNVIYGDKRLIDCMKNIIAKRVKQ